MAWYPRAADHNIPPGPADPPIVPRIIVVHTMAGTIESAENHFRDGSGIEAHFGVAMDGRVWQWRETGVQADAQAAGNNYCISIETEDEGDPSRPWTPEQLLALDVLITWLGQVHSIPMRLVSATAERGIGYHRQFPEWNPHVHSCPGDVRLGQLVNVLIPALNQEDISIVDAETKKYFDSKFANLMNAVTGTGTALKNIINAARDDVKAAIVPDPTVPVDEAGVDAVLDALAARLQD